jgi:starvation-inducible DNA-binding protein
MKPNIGLEAKSIKGSVEVLTDCLSNTQVLFIKTQGFHWNVAGPSFMEMHLLFEKQYNELKDAADEIAERIRQLGGKSEGSMKEFLHTSKIKETSEKNLTAIEMTKELLDDHEFIIRELRKGIEKCEEEYEDAGTTDFLTDLLQRHEKTAWMLREYSKKV